MFANDASSGFVQDGIRSTGGHRNHSRSLVFQSWFPNTIPAVILLVGAHVQPGHCREDEQVSYENGN